MRPSKLLLITFVITLIAFSALTLPQPVMALVASCEGYLVVNTSATNSFDSQYRLNGSGPGVPSSARSISAGVTTNLTWVLPGPGNWNIILVRRNASTGFEWLESAYPLNTTCLEPGEQVAGPPAMNLYDGRLNNNQLKDVAAPVAIYCTEDTIDVYKIDAETGDGTRIISVAQVEGMPESTQLLGSAQGVELYWLDTGEYQINASNFEGTPYWINWVGCSSDALMHTLN